MAELKRPTLWQVFMSVAAAMFGVQSQRKREYDFEQGRFRDYAIVGGIFAVLFVVAVTVVVQVVMYVAGY
jgi:hypothetical protein